MSHPLDLTPTAEESEQDRTLLRIACRAAKLGGWVASVPDMRVTWSNETAIIHEEAPGFSPSVTGGLAYYAPEYREQITRAFAACVAQGDAFDMDLEIITGKGHRAWTRVIGEAVRNAAGVITHVQGACQDISEQVHTAQQIQSLDLRLRETLETLPDAFFILSRSFCFTYLNSEAERLLQRDRGALLGRNIWKEFAEAVGTESDHAYHRAMSSGVTVRFEQFYAPLDRWLGVEAHPTGEGLAVYFRDVSERRAQLAKYLAQMESRFLGLLEAAPDAMVVVNEAGAIVLVNLQAEKQFGYHRDELIGQRVQNIIPEGFAERLIAAATPTAAEALAQQIGTGIELSARRKDGTQFPIELRLSPLHSADEILVTAAIRDITVRKAAEQRLVELESRMRGMLEAAPDAMVLVNLAGEIILVNAQAERHFGYPRVELVGEPLQTIIPDVRTIIPDVKRRIVAALRAAGESVAPEIGAGDEFTPEIRLRIVEALRSARLPITPDMGTGIELAGRRKDGSELPIELTLSILQTADGALITVAIRDISARKQAEALQLATLEELHRSNEDLSQFAYIASHDLQEPLRMVASYTQLLSRRYQGQLDADADQFIAFAVDGAKRMQRLIQDLLAYSRVGTNGKEFRNVSSAEALEQALLNLDASIGETHAIITHEVLPTVFADAGQLVQLFQNLIGNAVKYQKPGTPRVHVTCSKGNAGPRWQFAVTDNGLGIDSQYFAKIFGMFQRLHLREQFSGTGIGLAICKKIVERHGGIISVESQLGDGATFRFSLEGARPS